MLAHRVDGGVDEDLPGRPGALGGQHRRDDGGGVVPWTSGAA
ncbi:hypothetical protein JOD57_004508 [Geodermatophilus bullaregiensis]|nr:hypothetical protein [Geodermatophilus bullaregiensis]